jgi:ubiquinone/menaquinone biosynthesis C-methylase UbiE
MREETAKRILDKVRGDYDAIAADFSATRNRLWPEMERFREFIKTGDRVLDIGCGNGRAYQLFTGLAIEYEGLDVSEKLLSLARASVRDMLANFRVGSMLSLPYDNGEFDAALAVAVLHHVPSARYRLQALREAGRVIKPGGWLLMVNWNLWKPRYLRDLARATLKKLSGASDLDFRDALVPWNAGRSSIQRYCRAFTGRELRGLCRQAGLEVIEQYYTSDGKKAGWWRGGENILTICRKKE